MIDFSDKRELSAISLSWYGYFTTKEIPSMAYVVWDKLSEQSKTVFRNLSDQNLGGSA